MITDAERRTLLALQTCERGAIYARRLPITLPKRSNARGHWAKHADHYKHQRTAGLWLFREVAGKEVVAWFHGAPGRALVVRIVREAPRLLDDDGAVTAAKSLRDGIADALGIDDNDARVTWLVAQVKAKTASVLVEVYALGETK